MKHFIALATFAAIFTMCIARLHQHKSSQKLVVEKLVEGPQRRIINGKPATSGQFPWQAGLFTVSPHGRAFCGGALISSQFILTAAHCLDGWKPDPVLGATNLTIDEPSQIFVDVDNVYMHEQYNASNDFAKDIALIKLKQRVTCTKFIQPIRLADRNDYEPGGTNVVESGWGQTQIGGQRTEDLQFVELRTITRAECFSGPLGLGPDGPENEFKLCCDGSQNKQAGKGDSGGGLVKYDENGQATHVGIDSFFVSTHPGYPSVYTRTSSYIPWIEKTTGLTFPLQDPCNV